MKKYVRAIICALYSLMKFCIIKAFFFNNFYFSIFNIISPFTEIEVESKSKLVIGKMVRMRSGCKLRVRNGAEMKIGKNTALNHGCIFTARERIIIGENVQFGPNVLIYDHDHDYRKTNGLKNLDYKTNSVEIGDNTWIGANVIILKGVKIGENCVIAAGTVLSSHNMNKYYRNNSLIYQKRDNKVIDIVHKV